MAIPFLTNIDVKNNELLNAKLQNLAVTPEVKADEAGKIFFDTASKKIKYNNGDVYIDVPTPADLKSIEDKIPDVPVYTLESGDNNGTVKFGVGTELTEVKVTGLGTAAYTSAGDYAKPAEVIKGISVNGEDLNPSAERKVDISIPTKTSDIENDSHIEVVTETDASDASETPAFGDSVTVVSTVTRDSYGHVTKVNTKQVTLPELPENKTLTVKVDDTTTKTYDTSSDVTVDLTNLASKDYVGEVVAANDAMVFKGIISNESDLPGTYRVGWTYRVVADGIYAGQNCEVGDLLIALTSKTDVPSVENADWTVAQTNIDGAITKINSGDQITVTGTGSSRTISLELDDTVAEGTYNKITVNSKGRVTAGETVDYLTAHPEVENGTDSTEYQTLEYGDTFSVLTGVTKDKFGHVTAVSTVDYTLPGAIANAAKKAVVAIPAGTEVNINHNLGVTGITIGATTVYPITISIYETATGQMVYADTVSVDSNTAKVSFSTAVESNQYYAVIVG